MRLRGMSPWSSSWGSAGDERIARRPRAPECTKAAAEGATLKAASCSCGVSPLRGELAEIRGCERLGSAAQTLPLAPESFTDPSTAGAARLRAGDEPVPAEVVETWLSTALGWRFPHSGLAR